MSAMTDLIAELLLDDDVSDLVGDRIVADRAEQGTAKPFIVISASAREEHRGLDGTLHQAKNTFELQIWADTRASADAVADVCTPVITTAGGAVLDRSGGYSAELDMEASLLAVEWWD